jgi:hypothetical protein
MKVLQVVLVVLAGCALFQGTIQTFRHAFVLWVEPRDSVLLKYDETREEILSAGSLDELVQQFEEARKKVQQWEQGKSDKEKQQAKSYPPDEPYKSEWMLRKAIETWEDQQREIWRLHFYWSCGLAILLAGLAAGRWFHPWLGAAWIITAFVEMIWWTSPAFNIFGSQVEFDRLVLWKLVYSLATLAILLGCWYLLGITFPSRTAAGQPGDSAGPPPAGGPNP